MLMRPDIVDRILSETKLQVFEAISLKAENTEQLITKQEDN